MAPKKTRTEALLSGPLTPGEKQLIFEMFSSNTEEAVAKSLKVNRLTLLRGLAGRPLRASTAECIRSRLRVLSQ